MIHFAGQAIRPSRHGGQGAFGFGPLWGLGARAFKLGSLSRPPVAGMEEQPALGSLALMVSIQSIGVVNVCLVRSLGSFNNTPGALVLGPVVDHLFGAVPLLGGEIWSIPRCFSSNTRKTRSQSAIRANSSSNTRKHHRYRQKCQLPSRIWRMGASGKPQKNGPVWGR